jgi:DNA repair protein SbcD/Mre11
MRFRFLHAADLHLDSPFKGLSGQVPADILSEVRRSTFHAYERLVELAVREATDFVLFAGDIYDLADRSLAAQVAFQRGLEQLAEHGIRAYVIHGNHDPLDGGQAHLRWPDTVHVFSGERVEGVPFIKNGREAARVYGRSYPTGKFKERIAADYRRDADVPFAIGLLHTNLDGDLGHEAYAPSSRAELVAQGFDYWALGHIHKRAVIEEDPWIVYAGNLQGRSVKETGAKGCYLVDVDGGKVVGAEFRALDAVRWEQVDVDLTGAMTEGDVLARAEERLLQVQSEADGRPLIARVRLTGETQLHAGLRRTETLADWTAALQDLFRGRRPWLWIESLEAATRDEIDRARLRDEEHFVGDLLRLADRWREDVEAGAEDPVLDDVLKSVYQHRRVKKHLGTPGREEMNDLLQEAEELLLALFAEKGERV